MSFHVRVLRGVLLLGSVLTLTGIHHDGASLSSGWRLSQLVPISLTSVTLALNLTHVAMSQHVQEALLGLGFGIGVAVGLLMLVWYIWRRKHLHQLVRQVARLERFEDQIFKSGDTAFLKGEMALILIISIVLTVSWAAVLSSLHFHNPIIVPIWVPEPLTDGIGLTAVFIAELAGVVVLQAELITLTLLVAGLTDAAALQLRLIQRALLGVCFREVTGEAASPTRNRSGQVNVATARAEEGHEAVIKNKINSTPVAAWPGGETVDDLADLRLPHAGDDTAATSQLQRQSERYRLVYQLVSDTADVFSAPLLWLHAAVAATLLLAGYVVAVTLTGQAHVSINIESLCLVMVHWFACIAMVTGAGSHLIQQSEELRDVVAKKCWSARMSAAARGELQVLLEQTRTPLALDVWGLFNVQKSVLLSVLSFVLTYFVIMLQMIR